MVLEQYSGLLLGTILTLFVSIISMILTNHFSERRWRHQKEFEQEQETIQQVYSPLYFFLENLEFPFSVLTGSFKIELEGKEEKIVIPEDFWAKRVKSMREQINHINLKRIIENNLAVLKPPEFRKEIIAFMQLLRVYEESFDMMDLDKEQSKIGEELEIIRQVTIYLHNISLDFQNFLLNNILDKETSLNELAYQSILTKTLSDKIMQELIKFAYI